MEELTEQQQKILNEAWESVKIIEIERILWMIEQSKYLEEDNRHTEGFRSGVKTAHAALKSQLEGYIEDKESKD